MFFCYLILKLFVIKTCFIIFNFSLYILERQNMVLYKIHMNLDKLIVTSAKYHE